MNSEFDLTREVAEKVLKRAMAPVREKLEEATTLRFTDGEQMGIPLGRLKELDRDLGVLGITLATRYSEQVEYQTGLGVMSAENIRLRTTIDTLLEMIESYKDEIKSLADYVAKTKTVNAKLKELQPVKAGFHA